jgi:hypothetical protein
MFAIKQRFVEFMGAIKRNGLRDSRRSGVHPRFQAADFGFFARAVEPQRCEGNPDSLKRFSRPANGRSRVSSTAVSLHARGRARIERRDLSDDGCGVGCVRIVGSEAAQWRARID